MDADSFFRYFEVSSRTFLPSVEVLRIRPSNNYLQISFKEVDDFVIAVMAATGANIKLEVVGTFEKKLNKDKKIDSCFLKFDLYENCLDIRLALFLYEVLGMKRADGLIAEDIYELEINELKGYETWLTKEL